MIIGVDGNEANVSERVGVHQMAFETLWGLFKLEDKKKRGNKYTGEITYYLREKQKESSYWNLSK